MREFVVECAGLVSADQFWQRYLDAVKPASAEHFGRNLDAFWDATERGGPGWPGAGELVLKDSASLASLCEGLSDRSFLKSLQVIAAESTAVKIRFE